MDPNTPPSFMSLLEGDDSPQVGGSSATPIPAHNHHVSYPPYVPQNYEHHPHHPYYPPHLTSRHPSGSSQNPRPCPPPYYTSTHNEPFNVHGSEYPYYPPYYPPPPPQRNYLSAGSNSTPSSTPTGSVVGLGQSETNIEASTDEGDVEEVMGGTMGAAKKWTFDEDQQLIRAWINVGTDPIVGADQKKASFWSRVASTFNEYRPQGALPRTAKTCNSRWLRCAPIVNKWTGIMLEVERSNHSGWNDAKIVEEAHRLYNERTSKKFELEHWYGMLKDQPKWRAICDPPKSGSGSSKRSKPDTEEGGDEGVDGGERPEGRKAAKRRMKQKAHNIGFDVVASELKDIKTANMDMNEMFKEFFITTKQEMSQKILRREAKLRREEDRIMNIDTSTMPPQQASYYEQRKAEIMNKRYGSSSSHQ